MSPLIMFITNRLPGICSVKRLTRRMQCQQQINHCCYHYKIQINVNDSKSKRSLAEIIIL